MELLKDVERELELHQLLVELRELLKEGEYSKEDETYIQKVIRIVEKKLEGE